MKIKLFYGWYIVAVGMVVLAVESGGGFYSFGLFFNPLVAGFGGNAPDAPTGHYSLAVGMYDGATGVRLPAFHADSQPVGDRIVLRVIELTTR